MHIAVTPSNGSLVHAIRVNDGQSPTVIDGRIIQPAACNLRRGVGFVPVTIDGKSQKFQTVADTRAHCLRCVRAIALDSASSDEERVEVDRAYRAGELRIA